MPLVSVSCREYLEDSLRIMLYLDLKDPDGWRSSSFRKILLHAISVWIDRIHRNVGCSYHPATLESAADSIRGVSIHGFCIVVRPIVELK
jgi:hypothetical protein